MLKPLLYSPLGPLLMCLLVCACSGSDSASSGAPIPADSNVNEQQEERFKAAHKPMVIKWSESNQVQKILEFSAPGTPSSIGLVINLARDPNNSKKFLSGNCQGSLIGPDLVATNRHCIPKNVLKGRIDCSQRVKVLFPRLDDNTPYDSGTCKEIVATSEYNKDIGQKAPQPDWAIIRLHKRFDDRFLKPDTSGVYTQEEFYAFLPLLDPKNGKISVTRIACNGIQDKWLTQEYRAEKSPIVFLNCDRGITKGFSGLTLFRYNSDKSFSPVAILSHIRAPKTKSKNLLISKSIIASNMSCIPLEPDQELPASCDFDPYLNHYSQGENRTNHTKRD